MGIPVALNERTNSICKEGSGRYAEEKTKLVPGEGSGLNVCRLDLSGWLPREVLHPAQSAPRNAPRDERICYMRTADYLASLFAVLAAVT